VGFGDEEPAFAQFLLLDVLSNGFRAWGIGPVLGALLIWI
jgi:hypothetical protein